MCLSEPETRASLPTILKRRNHPNTKADTKQFIQANFYDESPMELTGGATLLGVLTKMVLRGQLLSLIYSILIIFIIMTIVFRSITGGLLATLPMVASVIMMFGMMGYLDIPLNIKLHIIKIIL